MDLSQIYIIIDVNEVNKIPLEAENVFCRSDYISQLINKENFNVINPDPEKTSSDARNLFIKENQLTNLIIEKTNVLYKSFYIHSTEELLKPYLISRISSYLYMQSIIPDSKKYFLFLKGKWVHLTNKEDVIIEIENKLSYAKDSIYFLLNECSSFKYNLIDYFLGFIQKCSIKGLLKRGKKFFIFTDKKSYFFNKLTSILSKDNKNIIFTYLGNNRIKYFYYIFKQILSYSQKNRIHTGLFIIPNNFLLNYNFETNLEKEINYSQIVSKKYSKILSRDLNIYLSKTISFYKYVYSIFKNVDIDLNVVSHSKRFPKNYALTEALENLGFKNYLISHGSHTIQSINQIDKKASEQLALGLLYSNNKNTISLSQSLFADQYLEREKRNFIKIYPIESVLENKKNKDNGINLDENQKLVILHAGTVKPMGVRRYLYHSSSEYIGSLLNICKKLEPIKNHIKIIVRIRPVSNELTMAYLKDVLDLYKDFVQISKRKSFLEELCNIDCLMALSSTTLEQALNNGIPSMSIGETGYDHLSHYRNYILKKPIKKYEIYSKVEKMLEKKFVYLKDLDRKKVLELRQILY